MSSKRITRNPAVGQVATCFFLATPGGKGVKRVPLPCSNHREPLPCDDASMCEASTAEVGRRSTRALRRPHLDSCVQSAPTVPKKITTGLNICGQSVSKRRSPNTIYLYPKKHQTHCKSYSNMQYIPDMGHGHVLCRVVSLPLWICHQAGCTIP